MHRTPFTIRELDEVLYKLQPGKTPGVDGLPAQLYRRLPPNLKRHLDAGLRDIAIGKTDVPPDWANLVHPLYMKGNWANPDNWRPIVCATMEATESSPSAATARTTAKGKAPGVPILHGGGA